MATGFSIKGTLDSSDDFVVFDQQVLAGSQATPNPALACRPYATVANPDADDAVHADSGPSGIDDQKLFQQDVAYQLAGTPRHGQR